MGRVLRFSSIVAALCMLATALVMTRGGEERAEAQVALTLGDDYAVTAVDSPGALAQQNMGFGGGPLVNAGDLNGDGINDLLVTANTQNRLSTAQNVPRDGWVHAISGADGSIIYTVPSPDPSPATQPAGGTDNFFSQYLAGAPDFASCVVTPAPAPGADCTAATVGGPDGAAEFLVGAIRADVDGYLDIGRAYLMDGRTGSVLKRIDMPDADREYLRDLPNRGVGVDSPPRVEFARTVLVPTAGFSATATTPQRVIRGDITGDEAVTPDIIVGSGSFFDMPDSNPTCDPGPCFNSGRAYFYRGEDIVGSDPDVPLETPFRVVRNPMAQTDDITDPNTIGDQAENFSHSITPIGDVGGCTAGGLQAGEYCPRASSTNIPDGVPDVVIPAHRTDWPYEDCFECGVVYLVDGNTGTLLRRYASPQPQPSVIWGFSIFNSPAIGDVAGSTLPDFYAPAVRFKVTKYAQGRGFIMNGDFKTGPNTVNIGILDDPTPVAWSQFGTSSAGIGNVAGDPKNEILVAQWGSEATAAPNDATVFDVFTGDPLYSFQDPAQQNGSGFGIGATSMGDLNNDGRIDFAFGSGGWDSAATTNVGRVYLFKSKPAPQPVDHERSITLALRRHLRAKGVVAVTGPTECVANVPVIIKRNGKRVKQTTTNDTGAYAVKLRDRPGTYQAVANLVALDELTTCLKATSPKRKHSH